MVEGSEVEGRSFAERLYRLRDDKSALVAISIFLVIIVWITFGQTVRHAFINYDDNVYVYESPVVPAGLTSRGIFWALTFAEIGHWHPVTWLSHMLDCELFGLRPGGHHLINVLLHALNVILLFLVLKEMTGAFWRSAIVATLFAIHPQRVESVAWIAERKDVLSGFFFMATLLAYVHYARQRFSIARYCLVAILFALGLMSKGMLVTLPFVLLLLDYWPLGRITPGVINSISRPQEATAFWRLVAEKIPLLCLSAASCVATTLSPEKIAVALRMALPARIENAVVSYLIYIKQMLYPVDLTLPYFNPPGGFPLWQIVLAFGLLILVSIAALCFRKTHPFFLVGWFWYLGMMGPVIGLVQISYYTRADRYSYLPHIGLYLALTWGIAQLIRPWRYRREIGVLAVLLVTVLLIARAHAQTSHWRDSETLWRYVLGAAPNNYVARNNLGLVLDEKGELEAAIDQFEQSLAIQPDYAETHNNFGNALCHAGRIQDAISHYKKSLALVPGLAQVQNNLGTAYGQNGQLAEAMTEFRKAIKTNPNFAGAHNNLGYALLLAGRDDEALPELIKALELKPDSAETHSHLADLFRKQGRTADAIAHYRKVLELRPNTPEVRRKLSETLAEAGP